MSGAFGKSNSGSKTKQLTPKQLSGYFDKLNSLSAGGLSSFARRDSEIDPYQRLDQGTIDSLDYQELTPEQLQSVGGAGATRRNQVNQGQDQAIQEITADPSMSVFQKQRARQLTNQESQDRLDAINQETEAAIADLASQQAARSFDANRARADLLSSENAKEFEAAIKNKSLKREDMEALARIFFGGKGSNSSSSSNSFKISGGIGGSYSPGG